MQMATLAEIFNRLTGLEKRIEESDKAKATLTESTLATLKTDIASVKTDVESKLTQALSDLETAKASLKSESEAKASLITALDAACAAVKIEGGDADKIKALAPAAKIEALKTNAADTVAKLHVDASKIPNAPAVKQGDEPAKAKATGRELFKASIKIV